MKYHVCLKNVTDPSSFIFFSLRIIFFFLQITDVCFANHLNIFILQITDFHFVSFHKLQWAFFFEVFLEKQVE